MTPVLISIKQVAQLLTLSTRTIRRAWYSGELPPPIKIGRSVRWRLLDIENYQGNYSGEHLSTNGQGREAS